MTIYSRAKMTPDQVLERYNMLFGDYYDYSELNYINARTKVTLICPLHGKVSTHPFKGCPKCGNARSGEKSKHSQQRVIDDFMQVHGTLYDYSRVYYADNNTKVEIICSTHGSFFLSPHKHKGGRGCPSCGILAGRSRMKESKRGRISAKRLSFHAFLERANKIHNDYYDYSLAEEMYEHTGSLIDIICPEHGIFSKRVSKHLQGRGCPKCKKTQQYSKMSHEWLISLDKDIILEYRLPEKPTRVVDGFDPKSNTIYQFHGDFWHGNPKTHNQDAINPIRKCSFGELYEDTKTKDDEIINMGYNLIVMWESEWKALSRQKSKRTSVEYHFVS